MSLVATLLVRDEVDVVEVTLQHLLAQGAKIIIATDNGSVDGTRELLSAYQDRGLVHLIDEPSHDYRQGEWVTRMARLAARDFGATWVLNSDADEFWLYKDRSRTLAEVLSELPDDVHKVRAWRSDLVGLIQTDGRPWPKRLVWRDTATVSERGTPLGSKVVHRADPEVVVAQGNHNVEGPLLEDTYPDYEIEVLHVPRRSWAQYAKKIDNGGSAYAANSELPESMGWHWRLDYERLLNGELRPLYDVRSPGPRTLVKGLRSGRYVRDTWLRKQIKSWDIDQKLLVPQEPESARKKI